MVTYKALIKHIEKKGVIRNSWEPCISGSESAGRNFKSILSSFSVITGYRSYVKERPRTLFEALAAFQFMIEKRLGL